MLTNDLAYGRWLKVPSRWQFWAQAATVIPCALMAAWVFQQIERTYPLVLEGEGLPAPVAKIWAASALIFEGKQEMPPFATEAMLIAGAIGVVYMLLERSEADEEGVARLDRPRARVGPAGVVRLRLFPRAASSSTSCWAVG